MTYGQRRNWFLPLANVCRENALFFQNCPSSPHFCTVFYHLRRVQKNGPRGPFSGFWGCEHGLLRTFGVAGVSSLFVVMSTACVFERHDAKSQVNCSKQPLLAATRAFSLRTPSMAHFLTHPTAPCPRSVIHAGQKCSQFCEIGRSCLLNELCLELVPQKEVQGRQILRTRWLQLDCVVHHRLVVFTSQLASLRRRAVQEQKITPRLHEAAHLGTMYSSIILTHSSPLIFSPGSTKCHVGAMSRAPMMPETVTPRVIAFHGAVNRSGGSSSSSASGFELLRSQILGKWHTESDIKTMKRQLRDKANPNISSCSDVWTARAAGQNDSSDQTTSWSCTSGASGICLPPHRLSGTRTIKLGKHCTFTVQSRIIKILTRTHTNKGHRETDEQAPKRHREDSKNLRKCDVNA